MSGKFYKLFKTEVSLSVVLTTTVCVYFQVVGIFRTFRNEVRSHDSKSPSYKADQPIPNSDINEQFFFSVILLLVNNPKTPVLKVPSEPMEYF